MKSTCTSSPRVGWRWIWRASVSTLVAVDLEGDQRVGAALAGEDVLQLAGGHGDRDGVGAEAVDDGGDLPCTAQAAGGAGAQLGARLGGEDDVRHGDARPFGQPRRTDHCGRSRPHEPNGRRRVC